MIGIGASSFIVVGGSEAVGFRGKVPVVASGAYAFVIERSVPQLLAIAGEAQIGQAFDGVKEIVDAGLYVEVETEVFPVFVRFDKCAWLRILAVFGLEEVMDNSKIALVADL